MYKKLILVSICLVFIGSSIANAGTKERNLNNAEIKKLIGVVDKIAEDGKKNGIAYVSKYYSKNTRKQLANYLKIWESTLDLQGMPEEIKNNHLKLKLAQVIPLAAIDNKKIIKATQEGGVRKIIEKFESLTAEPKFLLFRCSAFVNESGWKVQSVEASSSNVTDESAAVEYVSRNCYLKHPKAPNIGKTPFINADMQYLSEFRYLVYLNNNLILNSGMDIGTASVKLPLNKGKNKLLVVLGASEKNLIVGSDQMSEIAKKINGFSFIIAEEGKTIVEIKSDKGSRSIEREFRNR